MHQKSSWRKREEEREKEREKIACTPKKGTKSVPAVRNPVAKRVKKKKKEPSKRTPLAAKPP